MSKRRANGILDSRLCHVSASGPTGVDGHSGSAGVAMAADFTAGRNAVDVELWLSGGFPVIAAVYSMVERGGIALGRSGPVLVRCRGNERTANGRDLRFDAIGPDGFSLAFSVAITREGAAWQRVPGTPVPAKRPDGPEGELFLECSSALPSAERIGKLLQAGTNPNATFELSGLSGETGTCLTALVCRPGGGDCADATARLLAAGADPNLATSVTHRTPLLFAVANDKLDSMRLLVAAGADPNTLAWDPKFASPLRLAIQGGSHLKYKYFEVLFAAGARFDLNDCLGMTPIHFAIERRDLGSLRAMLLLGSRQCADVVADANGLTPLQWAIANWGEVDAIRLLLAHGARPAATGRHGFTALHTAALCGHAPAAALLLKAGCPAGARTLEGETPAELYVRAHGPMPRVWSELLGPAGET